MDTRHKIHALEDLSRLLNESRWTVVATRFHMLTVEIADWLESAAAGGSLLVIILDDDQALLDMPARAALAAALRSVCAVVPGENLWWREICHQHGITLIEDPALDEQCLRSLRERVLRPAVK